MDYKTVRLGTVSGWNGDREAQVDVFCAVKFKDGELSISGVEGPRSNGDAWGSCGQIVMHLKAEDIAPAPGWTTELIRSFLLVWDVWHLNGMRAGCAHQRATWDTAEELTLIPLTWGETYHEKRRAVEAGTMPGEEYAEWPAIVKTVERLTMGFNPPKHPDLWGEEGRAALARVLVKPDAKGEKTKAAGWVTPSEHPKGLLMKPCDVCGYKYGSKWLREEVPADVLTFLENLPDADKTPAWV